MTKISKILLFAFTLLCLITYISSVNAEVISCNAGDFSKYGQTQSNVIHSWSNNCFKNKGEGNVIVNFTIFGKALYKGTYLYVNNAVYMCEDTNFTAYTDNSNQTQHVSAVCHLPNISNTGVQQITIYTVPTGTYDIYAVPYLSYTNVGTTQNYTSAITSINSTLSSIDSKLLNNNTWNNYIYEKIVDIDNLISTTNGNQTAINQSIQAQTQQQHIDSQAINQSIQDTNNTLKDSSIDNPSSNTSSWASKNATNGVITNLLTLPIKLMQGYVNGMNSSCSAFNLGSLFGTEIILPCINVSSLIGSSLWSVIDVLFSGFMIFAIGKKLIKIFNDFTNMKSNQVDELYGGGA